MTQTPVSPDTRQAHGALKADAVGTANVVALVIAAAAPIAAAVALIPLGMLLGDGAGFPGAVILIAVALTLFSLGYVRLVPIMKNAGAFYAYVSAGLGKPAGVAAAYLAAVAYLAACAGMTGGIAYYSQVAAGQFFHISFPWILPALVGIALSTLLAIRGVAITARVLLTILAIEVIAVSVVDIAILVHQGAGAFTFDVFKPSTVFSGSIGITGVFAMSLFLGFEATAIYAEEAKDPHKTLPRATYWVVGIICVFNALTGWAMVAGTGVSGLVPAVGANPGQFLFTLSDRFVGHGWTDMITVLNLTSLLAGLIAFQNAGARYLFSLSRDEVLPRQLARTHRQYGTPWLSLTVIALVCAALAGIYAAAGVPVFVGFSTSMIGLNTIGLLVAFALVSVAIVVFFWRRGERGFPTVIAPAIAAVVFGYLVVTAATNYSILTDVTSWWMNHLAWLIVVVAAVGVGMALWLRARRPEIYRKLGSSHI